MTQMLVRDRRFKVRGIDTEARTADFVAATEGPVPNWRGSEWLRMAGADLTRYLKNPIVLNAHNYGDSTKLVGAADVKIEGRKLYARVTFAETDRAEELWELVASGFLRTVSVGYLPLEWRVLDQGEVDGEGDAQVRGPGVVITKWELLEISLTPMPADQDALLRRSFFNTEPKKGTRMDFSRMLAPAKGAEPEAVAGAPVPTTTPQAATSPASAPATPLVPATRAMPAPLTGELDDEVKARIIEAKKRQIRALAPESLREFADQLVLEGVVDTAVAQKRLQEEYAKRSVPVGTPEPPKTTAPAAPTWPAALTDQALARSLKR